MKHTKIWHFLMYFNYFMLCQAYEVAWDFVIAPEQQWQWQQPHQNHAASHIGEDPSCIKLKLLFGSYIAADRNILTVSSFLANDLVPRIWNFHLEDDLSCKGLYLIKYIQQYLNKQKIESVGVVWLS